MADSVASQPSWIPLIESALSHQVIKMGKDVLPDTKGSIIYGPKPAFFQDGQTLATTHYHVDACLWTGDTFITGATFLMPSKVPQAGLESYSVDLDDTTGVYHVFLRKTSLRTSLALMKASKPNHSSHFVEFSNGKMTAVSRVECAATSLERGVQQIPHEEHRRDTHVIQSDSVDHQYAACQPSLPDSLVSTPHQTNPHGTISIPTESDSSITEFGRVVGQQAASDCLSFCNFPKSILHIVPQKATSSTYISAEDSDGDSQAQESVTTAFGRQASETYISFRRSSLGSQDSEISLSTLATSPTSSTFEKSSLADLPKVPITPGKPTYVTKALNLENRRGNDLSNDFDCDRKDLSVLGLNLMITHRQLNHLDEIENSASPCLEQASPSSGLAMTEDGQIFLAEDIDPNATF